MTRVLIIVQNLAMPFDRRVWLECQALVSDGYEVAVVCPRGKGDPAHEVINAMKLYKYRPHAPGGSKLNKTMEYMAFELPVVAFDLRETRVSAGDAAIYVTPNDEYEYAEAIVALMDDKPRRSQMGKLGRVRVEQELAWSHQRLAYLAVYRRVICDRMTERTGN